jgi:son of sevenless-like protein
MVIYTALNSVAVSRLKQTWEKVPKRCIKILEDIDELFSMRFNYKNYRDALAKATPPVVPYIGLYTKFLFAIEETNPSKLQNGLINFEKLRMIYNVMKELQKFQGKPYDFNIDSDVLWQFIDIKPLTESELYQLSTKHNETQRK